MEPVQGKRWRIKEADPATVDRLTRDAGLPPLLARLLAVRGIGDRAHAARFLNATLAGMHDPFLLKGMAEAVTRLATTLETGETVCVYGDYDVDGVTSVALLIGFFRQLGISSCYYIPRRLEEGYGLSAEGIGWAASRGATVIISVDCGITAVQEALTCAELGIDLIITDHHLPGDTIPPALAVINPLQKECPFPFKQLAGVGLAFNVAIALRSRLRGSGYFAGTTEPDLKEFLGLVALGTVADVVPLVDENRIFVTYGLRELTNSTRPGIEALKKVAGVTDEVGCGTVGFRLAPRLNAAGRLEDAAPGVELLLTDDRQRAATLAAELDAGNAERQALEQEILQDALAFVRESPDLARKKSIVLASEAWHPGVIGIVASRLVDLFHRPTILIALKDGNGRGSGRSIAGFHLHDALHACSEHLLKFGGHRHAAGLAIDEATLQAFVTMFDTVADGLLTPEDLQPELAIDSELTPDDIIPDLLSLLGSLEPFGMGNPEPVFVMKEVTVVNRRILKEKHLKFRVAAAGRLFDAIGFGMAGRVVPERIDLAFSLQENEWQGKKSLQLRIRDFQPAS